MEFSQKITPDYIPFHAFTIIRILHPLPPKPLELHGSRGFLCSFDPYAGPSGAPGYCPWNAARFMALPGIFYPKNQKEAPQRVKLSPAAGSSAGFLRQFFQKPNFSRVFPIRARCSSLSPFVLFYRPSISWRRERRARSFFLPLNRPPNLDKINLRNLFSARTFSCSSRYTQ